MIDYRGPRYIFRCTVIMMLMIEYMYTHKIKRRKGIIINNNIVTIFKLLEKKNIKIMLVREPKIFGFFFRERKNKKISRADEIERKIAKVLHACGKVIVEDQMIFS